MRTHWMSSAEPSPRERRKEKKGKERKGGGEKRESRIHASNKTNALGCSDTINPFTKQNKRKNKKKKKKNGTRVDLSHPLLSIFLHLIIFYTYFSVLPFFSIPTAKVRTRIGITEQKEKKKNLSIRVSSRRRRLRQPSNRRRRRRPNVTSFIIRSSGTSRN